MAKVGTSAIESRKLGYLLDSDVIVANKDELLYIATTQARAMFDSGYRAPPRALFPVDIHPCACAASATMIRCTKVAIAT
jgi:3-hydroxyacyl-CoA dehydrogenase